MQEVTVLIGGRAGDGINTAGLTIARLLGKLGYHIYMYFDYPSLIKGGHNYAIIRGTDKPSGAHRSRADFVIALTGDTLTRHRDRISAETVLITDSGNVRVEVEGASSAVPVREILASLDAPPIMGNSALIGGFARAAAIPWETVAEVFSGHQKKALALNLAVANKAFSRGNTHRAVPRAPGSPLPLVNGNEALALGLLKGGLSFYCAYPMTPTTNILHFLAENAPLFRVTVVHPENEIAVMLMALGAAYTGKRAATGTSGGGFCLMTEGLSFAGMAEIPVVIVMGQRTGPSTGLPTYNAQSDLHFVLHAGQGEFPRIIIAPGDAKEAYSWAAAALDLAWAWQVPVILLADKTLCEGTWSFDLSGCSAIQVIPPAIPVDTGIYRRYKDTSTGLSPALFPPSPGAVIKVNSYAHDEDGITTEEPGTTVHMAEKRKRKGEALASAVTSLPDVLEVAGDPCSKTAIVCFGSTAGVCREVGMALGARIVRPVLLHPFPADRTREALSGVERIVIVEENQEGQLDLLLQRYGIVSHDHIRRFDGRPFTVDELLARAREVS